MLLLTRVIFEAAWNTGAKYTVSCQLLNILYVLRGNNSILKIFHKWNKNGLKKVSKLQNCHYTFQIPEYAMKMTLKIMESTLVSAFLLEWYICH